MVPPTVHYAVQDDVYWEICAYMCMDAEIASFFLSETISILHLG